MLDRATRLCSTSPQMATTSPSNPPLRRRMVSASSSACVGCWCQPSPAFSTGQSTLSAISATAPELAWRMTMTSAAMALSVMAVSMRVSPFFTLDWPACMLTTSAPSRLPAISNDSRVRVLFSKKALIWVMPASRSSCLRAWPLLVRAQCSASSSRKRISQGLRSAIDSRCRCGNSARPVSSGVASGMKMSGMSRVFRPGFRLGQGGERPDQARPRHFPHRARSFSTSCAALWPGAPVTPPPGWEPAPHM